MPEIANTDLVNMLRAAAEDEHAAIIQYLRHAYNMGEGELACEIEGIAREEMRHFWILSRWIVRLGGEPTVTRGFTDLSGMTPPAWMERDVAAEDRAIAMYRDYLNRIQDPDLRADLEYILGDELRHHDDFAHFVDKATQEAEAAVPAEGEEPAPAAEAAPASSDKEALDWGVGHEYAALLQYLVHSFLTMDMDEEISSQLKTQAINEMQHMGWFGEELAEMGQDMPLDPHTMTLSADPQTMLEADVKLEQETSAMYGQFLEKLSDPGVKGVVEDARGQELYHEKLFTRLLKRLAPHPDTTPSSSKMWTIGSLKDKK